MKRQEHKQRFYLWDYIWWYGERWGQVRRTSRMDGSLFVVLLHYVTNHFAIDGLILPDFL